MSNYKTELNEFIRGKVKLYQHKDGYRFNIDSVLLASFVSISKKKANLLDIGTGSGILILLLALKYKGLNYYAIEIQESLYRLAKENFKLNNLNVNLINADIKNFKELFKPNQFDYIVVNPPYFRVNSTLSENEELNIARYEITLSVEDIFKASKYLLKDKGKLFLVYPTDRLTELIEFGKKYKLELKRSRFIYPCIECNSTHTLGEFVKGGKVGLKVEKPLIIYKDKMNKVYTDEVNYILENFV